MSKAFFEAMLISDLFLGIRRNLNVQDVIFFETTVAALVLLCCRKHLEN